MYFLCFRTLPKDCQMLLFSASYDDEVMKFAKTVVPDPVIVGLCGEEESVHNIKQYYVVCHDKEDKFKALSNIYGAVSIGQGIVFCHVSVKTNSFQGVQSLFFPIFSYFLSLFLFSPIFKLKPPIFLAGEAKICNKIENGIIFVCVFE